MPRVSQFAPLISVWTYCRRLHSAVCLLPLLSIELSCLTCRVWPSKVSRKTGSSFVLGVHHWNLASSIFATSWFCKVTHGEASSRQGFFVCLLLCMFASLLIVFAFFVSRTQTSPPTFTYLCLHHKHQRADLACLIRYSFPIQCSLLHYFVGFDCSQLKQSDLEDRSFCSNFFYMLFNIEDVLHTVYSVYSAFLLDPSGFFSTH